jgi:glucose uptake protein
MMLPATYAAALTLAVLTMLCWGSWANTLKLTGSWRFELYYFDYSIGVFLAAVVAAFTFGSTQGDFVDTNVLMLSFADNMAVASKLKMIWAFAGGVVFNLANLLLVAAIAVAGMSVAFPVGIGLALLIGTGLNYWLRPAGNPALIAAGAVLILLGMVISALAHKQHASAAPAKEGPPRVETDAAPGPRRVGRPNVRVSGGAKRKSPWQGIALSLACGLLMGLFYPLVERSKGGDMGLGPYAAAFCFALGVLLSTPLFNAVFMNVPVEGEPVPLSAYWNGSFKQHLLGILGGVIWCTGTVSNFVAASAPKSVNIGPAISYALGQGAVLVSALWGLLVWREFAGATGSVKLKVVLMLLLFVGGLALLSVAPLYN